MGDAFNPDPNQNPYETPPAFSGGPAPPYFQPGMQYELPAEAKQMAMLAHLLGALFGFLGPLIIWLTSKEKHPFIDDQGKESLNFQLTLLIGYAVLSLIWIVLICVSFGLAGIIPIPLILTILQLVFGIIGAVQANNGVAYRYPVNIRFIK